MVLGPFKNLRGCLSDDDDRPVICGEGIQFRYGLDMNYGEVSLIMKEDFWRGMRGWYGGHFAQFPVFLTLNSGKELGPWVLDTTNPKEYTLARTRMQVDALRFRKEAIQRFISAVENEPDLAWTDLVNTNFAKQVQTLAENPCGGMESLQDLTFPGALLQLHIGQNVEFDHVQKILFPAWLRYYKEIIPEFNTTGEDIANKLNEENQRPGSPWFHKVVFVGSATVASEAIVFGGLIQAKANQKSTQYKQGKSHSTVVVSPQQYLAELQVYFDLLEQIPGQYQVLRSRYAIADAPEPHMRNKRLNLERPYCIDEHCEQTKNDLSIFKTFAPLPPNDAFYAYQGESYVDWKKPLNTDDSTYDRVRRFCQVPTVEDILLPVKSVDAVRVLSYNVHNWHNPCPKGLNDPLTSQVDTSVVGRKIDHALTVIKAVNPDIVMLQEVVPWFSSPPKTKNDFTRIAFTVVVEAFRDAGYPFCALEDTIEELRTGPYYMLALATFSKYQIVETDVYQLNSERIVMRTKININGTPLTTVYNTQLEQKEDFWWTGQADKFNTKYGKFDMDDKLAAVGARHRFRPGIQHRQSEMIMEIMKSKNEQALIAGDMNINADAEFNMNRLLTLVYPFRVPLIAFVGKNQSAAAKTLGQGELNSANNEMTGMFSESVIDYFIVPPQFQHLVMYVVQTIGSDHYPIFMDIPIKPQ